MSYLSLYNLLFSFFSSLTRHLNITVIITGFLVCATDGLLLLENIVVCFHRNYIVLSGILNI